MSFDADTLYRLLPAIYRIRDAEQGGMLRELTRVIAEQVGVVQEDLDQLYDDQFIETCADWVVPYIGDLVGYRDLHHVAPGIGTARAEVTNTLRLRRRKGTAAALEELALDVSGWPAVVVEFFQRLATTQYLNHIRPGHHVSIDLRQARRLASINTPFDGFAHTADVRRIATRQGYYGIPNVGVFLWRTQSHALNESSPVRVDARRYLFHPLGIRAALYNRPQAERAVEHLATPVNVPGPLSRRELVHHLSQHYGPGRSLCVHVGANDVDVSDIHVCNLSDDAGGWGNMPSQGVAVDPELGRLAFAQDIDTATTRLRVSFCYGFTAEMGGGEYDRIGSLATGVTQHVPAGHSDIGAALNAAAGQGVVQVTGSEHFGETLSVAVAQDQTLVLQAASGSRPVLALGGQMLVSGGDSAEFTLDGFLISGGSIVVPRQIGGNPNRLQRLRLRHCTLVPGLTLRQDGSPLSPQTPSLIIESDNVMVEIERCIVGSLQIGANAQLRISNSIIDATSVMQPAYSAGGTAPGGTLDVLNTTVIGKVYARQLNSATNTLFLGAVDVQHIQSGCVRFSYVPPGSRVPRRYRCQPETDGSDAAAYPQFTSLHYGDPGYCQLRPYCTPDIWRGADDESEMGAFHDLFEPQREANLYQRFNEYLRFGMEAGVFYVS